MALNKILNSEIELINKLAFKPCGLKLTNLETGLESQEYFSHTFKLDEHTVKFRKAKITPTKQGQFVTIWKRNTNGITEPYNMEDDFSLLIIAVRKDSKLGMFIFPKIVLNAKNILSDKTKDGKRGIRVYPSWDLTTNKQAQKTQQWQLNYFIELVEDNQPDLILVKKLLIF